MTPLLVRRLDGVFVQPQSLNAHQARGSHEDTWEYRTPVPLEGTSAPKMIAPRARLASDQRVQ
jgi:hypothetical protein